MHQKIFQQTESILLKILTAPVSCYDNFTFDLFASVLANTDFEYHLQMVKVLFEMIEAIFQQKKRGRAENFKTKIIQKGCYLISMIIRMSNTIVRENVFGRILKLLQEENKDFIFIIFAELGSKSLSSIIKTDQKNEILLLKCFSCQLEKTYEYMKAVNCQFNDKSAKNMVLFMKPLVEILNMLGSDNTLLPERWRSDCKNILSALKDVLPVFEAKDKP